MKRPPDLHMPAVLAVCLLGAVLRFWALGSESLWFDETVTAWRIQLSWSGLWEDLHQLKNHGPLHYALLKWWCGMFGVSEFQLRFWSAVAGTLTVPLVYLTGRKLFTRSTGLLAAFLVCISQYNILYSQEARFYAINTLLPLLSMFLFIKIILCNERKFLTRLAYVLVSAAMLYNHYFAAFLLAAQFAFVFLDGLLYRRQMTAIAKSVALTILPILLFLPWIKLVFSGAQSYAQGRTVLSLPQIWDIPGAFKTYCGEAAVPGLLLILCMLIALITLRVTLPFAAVPSPSRSDPLRCRKLILLVLWIACPILLPFIISYIFMPVFSHRYNGAALSGFFILAAEGLLCLRPRLLRGGMFAVVAAGMIWAAYTYFATPTNQQWRQAVRHIETHADTDDLILFSRGYLYNYPWPYYSRRDDIPVDTHAVREFLARLGNPDAAVRVWQNLQIPAGDRTVWLILSPYSPHQDRLFAALEDHFGPRHRLPFVKLLVYRFGEEPPDPD